MADPDGDALRRRLTRERKARLEAEAIAERVTGELYAAVEKLGQTNRDLEDANQAIREFVAIASHDLGNPLTSVIGFADVLLHDRGESSDDDKRQMLAAILRQGQQMERLVSDLLILSRLEAGALEPIPVELDVARELER